VSPREGQGQDLQAGAGARQGEEEGARRGAPGTGVRAAARDPCAQGRTRRQGRLTLEDLKDMGVSTVVGPGERCTPPFRISGIYS
jgi:hypothetical protein